VRVAEGLARTVRYRIAFRGTDLRRDRTVERADDVSGADLIGRTREDVSAAGAALALHETRGAQARGELLEVRLGEVLALGDAVERERPGAEVLRELDHETHAVLAPARDVEGADGRRLRISYCHSRNSTVPLTVKKVAVGSTNPAKVAAVRTAMSRLAPEAAVVALDVASGVRAQPWGEAETKSGAAERARASLARADADLGIGLEGGVIEDGAGFELVSWVAVVDAAGRVGFASGLRFTLPAHVGDRLRSGAELGDVMDELFRTSESKKTTGAVGLLTEGFVSRSDAFADLVAMACAPFLFAELYR
jgi:inosine/xanthosine triphosphatase